MSKVPLFHRRSLLWEVGITLCRTLAAARWLLASAMPMVGRSSPTTCSAIRIATTDRQSLTYSRINSSNIRCTHAMKQITEPRASRIRISSRSQTCAEVAKKSGVANRRRSGTESFHPLTSPIKRFPEMRHLSLSLRKADWRTLAQRIAAAVRMRRSRS